MNHLQAMTEEQKCARIKEILTEMLKDPNVVMKTKDRYELQFLLFGKIEHL